MGLKDRGALSRSYLGTSWRVSLWRRALKAAMAARQRFWAPGEWGQLSSISSPSTSQLSPSA